MRLNIGLLRALMRGWVVVCVVLGALGQPVAARAEADAPPLMPMLVKDINTTGMDGINDSFCRGQLGTLGSQILFLASDDLTDDSLGCSVWKSDGTAAGTVKVKHIRALVEQSITVSNTLYFSVLGDTAAGRELWRSDGSEAGTYKLATVFVRSPFAVLSGTIYFLANAGWATGTQMPQLWKSDGTPGGTVLVKDLSGMNQYVVYSLMMINQRLYFLAPGTHFMGLSVWKSDGTPNGTEPAFAVATGRAFELTTAGNRLFYTADHPNGGTPLWISDGSLAGASTITQTASGDPIVNPYKLTPFGNAVYFWTTALTRELWRTNGTITGTVRLFSGKLSANDEMKSVGNTLYFFGDDDVHGLELMKTDGTPAGTVVVKDAYPSNEGRQYGGLTGLNNGLVFYGGFTQTSPAHLWVSDGSVTGTIVLTSGLHSAPWAVPQSNMVFAAIYDSVHGNELWTSDGTVTGTHLVKDINPNTSHAYPSQMANLNGKLLFTASVGGPFEPRGFELGMWQSNGTQTGTIALIPPTSSNDFSELKPIGNLLYFVAQARLPRSGVQLWRTDSTLSGTLRLSGSDSFVGNLSCSRIGCKVGPASVTDMGSYVLFLGRDDAHGTELWRSDGTPAGTALVKDIEPGALPSNISDLTRVGDTLFFHSDFNHSLWKSDGTLTGTQQITTVGYIRPYSVVISSTLFFLGSDDFYQTNELWKSDGTPTGTGPLQLPISGIEKIVGVNGMIICLTSDGKLWKTDGTTAGTQQLSAFDSSLLASTWRVVGNRLFISRAFYSDAPNVLIVTDGTPAGTQRLAEFATASAPGYIAALGEGFIFSLGNEVWAMNGTNSVTHKLTQLPYASNDAFRSANQLLIGNTLFFVATNIAPAQELWSLTFSDNPDAHLSVPDHVFRDPTNPVRVALDITNLGTGLVQSATLTATLGLSLTVVSDTSGMTPTVQGNTVVWALPNLSALAKKTMNVSVGLPNSTIGSRYPITFTLGTSSAAVEEKLVEIVTAKLLHLPLVFR